MTATTVRRAVGHQIVMDPRLELQHSGAGLRKRNDQAFGGSGCNGQPEYAFVGAWTACCMSADDEKADVVRKRVHRNHAAPPVSKSLRGSKKTMEVMERKMSMER